jgi:hypothetical protein
MFVLMRGTFPLEEFLFGAKLREIFWMLACDLAISAGWVVIGTEKGSKSSILHASWLFNMRAIILSDFHFKI